MCLICASTGLSQRRLIYGTVKDSTNKEALIGAHIQNLSSQKLTFSNEYGEFRLPVQDGDTIMLSNVGYQILGWIVDPSWFKKDQIEFALPIDTVYLAEVVIGDFPEYERFKKLIIDTRPDDTSFWYHGVPRPVMKGYDLPEKKEFMHPVAIATHPITFFYHAFNKKAKEQRKMQQINKRKNIINQSQQKFTREWVAEMTRLEGNDLTDFIAFCKFTPDYIATTPVYMIHEKMMALLGDFLNEGSSSNNKNKG